MLRTSIYSRTNHLQYRSPSMIIYHDHPSIFDRPGFIKNEFLDEYISIITNAKSENRKKGEGVYYEAHHILPQSSFQQHKNHKWNLVLLTANEHFRCHELLTKCSSGSFKRDMCYAFRFFSSNGNHLCNRKLTEEQREIAKQISIGKPFSEKHKENHRKAVNAIEKRQCPFCDKLIRPNVYKRHLAYSHGIGEKQEDVKWITNGSKRKQIPEKESIPDGWWRGKGYDKVNQDIFEIIPDKDELFDLYITQRMSVDMLVERYGYSSTIVCVWLKHYGIKKSKKQSSGDRDYWDMKTKKRSKGLWVTPIGDYWLISDIVDGRLKKTTMMNWCIKLNDQPIILRAYVIASFLNQNFPRSIVGKTYNEIGFDFISNEKLNDNTYFCWLK